jgi:hypothetical protein
VFVGSRILPREEEAMQELARYIIRASFSRERMTYLPEESRVIYQYKDAQKEKVFDALDGYYSNVSRGKRKKQSQDEWIPCILEPESSSREYRKNWARLIQKIYEIDPLTCPKCQDQMRIIAFIEDEEVIKTILKHLGLWEAKAPFPTIYLDDPESQILSPESFYAHPDYPMDFHRISTPQRSTSPVTISAIDIAFFKLEKAMV